MIQVLKKLFIGASIGLSLLLAAAPAVVMADTPKQSACEGAGGTFDVASGKCTNANGGSLDLGGAFKTVASTLIFLVGAISVIMIIVGGLRYVLSGGDSAGVKGAKDTILYAVIGVVVAILAYAIVTFVLSRFI